MGELVVRLESRGSRYVDTAGQQQGAIDFRVSAGIVGDPPVFIEEGGRPAVRTLQGVSMFEQQSPSGCSMTAGYGEAAGNYGAEALDEGMFIDGLTSPDQFSTVLPDVCGWLPDQSWHRVTAWGQGAVAELVDQMASIGTSRADRLAGLTIVAANLAQRAVPDMPNDAQIQMLRLRRQDSIPQF